jgi:hypothetical protein
VVVRDPLAEACEEYAQSLDDDVIWERFAAGRID